MMNFQKMMKQAQEMQFRIQEMQEKLADIDVEGESGGGLVKITMNCAGKVSRVFIEDSLMNTDKETLEDLIAAAMNDAVNKANQASSDKMSSVTSGLPIPPGMKIPGLF